ncbi:MAG: tetratricopeptide repeat protein [Paracoccaceae bacterium]
MSVAASSDNAVSEACISGKSEDRVHLTADSRIAICSEWMEEDQSARSVALLYRAELYAEQQQWDEAFQDYSEMLQLDADNPSVWYNRGALRARHFGQVEEAIMDFDEAVALTHDRPRARYFLHRAAAYGRLIEEESERTVEQDLEALHSMQSDLETFMVLTADKPWEEKKRAAAKDALTYVAARLKALGEA